MTYMKLTNIKNPDKFFELVDQAKGKVELVSSEGDRFNLKSSLSKYVAFTSIFDDDTIKEIELVCYDPEDVKMFMDFMLNGN